MTKSKDKGKKPLDVNNVCKCGTSGTKLHTCPYTEALDDNHEFMCNCCKKCQHECALNI